MLSRLGLLCGLMIVNTTNTVAASAYVFEAGHTSLQSWLLPEVPAPEDNQPNAARIRLGKKLFFDPRLSGDGNMSCGTCHSPLFGWSDGLPTAKGFQSKVLKRASPTVINTAYNTLQMWDGRKQSLEDQATGPMQSADEMNLNIPKAIEFMDSNPVYKKDFAEAYPNEKIGEATIAKAIASFERTVISNNSPFDQWVKGDKNAMTAQQIRGFEIFVDPNKGNCEVCHSAPNFTDSSFHNIGLASFADAEPDMGRHAFKPVQSMKGAFKTPTLRDITETAPYFHDGSAPDLIAVVEHYARAGDVKTNLSTNIKTLDLNNEEKKDLVAFMMALATEHPAFVLPKLPK